MGTLFQLVVAFFFAGIAGYLIFFMGRALLRGIAVDPRVWLEGLKLRRVERLIGAAEELANGNRPVDAVKTLRSAFYFDTPVKYPETIDRIHSHHMNILSHIISVAQHHGRSVDNLPVIEDLLASREQLLGAYIEHAEARDNLTRRRRQDKKETPAWAISEFTKKLDDIRDKLSTNRQSLDSQLDRAVEPLKHLPEGDEVTVH